MIETAPPFGEAVRKLRFGQGVTGASAPSPQIATVGVRVLAGGSLGLAGFGVVRALQTGVDHPLLIVAIIPISFAAYRFGLVAGLISIATCFTLVMVYVLPPLATDSTGGHGNLIRLAAAVGVSAVMAVGADRLRMSLSKLLESAESQNTLLTDGDAILRAVTEQRALFETVIGNAPVGIGVWDEGLRCVHVNDTLVEMNGTSRESMLGRPPDECIPERWSQWQPYFAAALRGESTTGIEFAGVDIHGRWGAVVASYYPFGSEDDVFGVAVFCTDVTEQRRAQEEIAQSEIRYRELSETMPALVTLVDAQGRSYYWNRAFFEYTGLTPDLLSRWFSLGLVPHEDIEAIAEHWSRETNAGRPVSAEIRVRRHDGVYRWHMARGVPLGSGGKWLLLVTDIDDGKRSEERLRASEERLSLAANATGIGVWDVDLASGAAIWSDSHFALLGYSTVTGGSADLGRWRERVHPEDRERVEAELATAQASCDGFLSEHRIIRADSGEIRWLAESGRFMKGPFEAAARLVGVSYDVTDRRGDEIRQRCLAEARAVLGQTVDPREALQSVGRILIGEYGDWVSVFTVSASPEGGVPAVERIVCHYDHNIPELETLAAAPPAINWDGVDGLPQVLRTGEAELYSFATRESFTSAGDPAMRQLSQSVIHSRMMVPLKIAGDIVGAISLASTTAGRYTADDLAFLEEFAHQAAIVLEKARLFADLREANAAKDEFLGLVSHELRTPITTILGNATVLSDRGDRVTHEDFAMAMRDIKTEAGRLNGIIENLLALARLERGVEVETELLFVRRIVARVLESHRAEHPGRQYRLSFPDELMFVEGNAVYLEQVFRNLIANAERYSPASEPVEISARADGDWLRMTVLDRGVGIDPSEAEELFEPFYRSKRTADVDGIGVGLSLCKRLVEIQHGKLSAAPREGGGAAFTISLPIAADHRPD